MAGAAIAPDATVAPVAEAEPLPVARAGGRPAGYPLVAIITAMVRIARTVARARLTMTRPA
jgi:hypothetical protein